MNEQFVRVAPNNLHIAISTCKGAAEGLQIGGDKVVYAVVIPGDSLKILGIFFDTNLAEMFIAMLESKGSA